MDAKIRRVKRSAKYLQRLVGDISESPAVIENPEFNAVLAKISHHIEKIKSSIHAGWREGVEPSVPGDGYERLP